ASPHSDPCRIHTYGISHPARGRSPAMTDNAVLCTNLSKAFGPVQAVHRLDLAVPRGQILAILGPSGCGKTTLLRLIAGFEWPDEGTISINGEIVANPATFVPPEKRRVGMVF
ncbi:MAG: ATP-binding cassette domain-containing protein, partial [Anaerolineae bacterium]|nr:ATP-binding cassette domain-containing protein [Anaerolineae bacterium]NIN95429.1 ATP-binding cassette domain-containing protein [Anaerolineae bacterium]